MGKFLTPNLPPQNQKSESSTIPETIQKSSSVVVSNHTKIKIGILLMFLIFYPILCGVLPSIYFNSAQKELKTISRELSEVQKKTSEMILFSNSIPKQYNKSDLLILKTNLEHEIENYNNQKALITNELHFAEQIKKMNGLDTNIIKCTVQIKEITNLLKHIENN